MKTFEKFLNSSNLLYLTALVSIYTFINNSPNLEVLYGDDSWVVVGSHYNNLVDKIVCCTITHPGSSIIHQTIFKYSPNTNAYINILFVFFVVSMLFIIALKKELLEPKLKFIFYILLVSSPMLTNYSLRSKPYILEALFSIFILFLLIETIENKSLNKKYILLFIFSIFISLSNIFVLISFFVVLFRKKIVNLKHFKLEFLVFIFFVLSTTFLSYQRRSNDLENFWGAYFSPIEGGIVLFFRWIYFSTIRIFSVSNKLDLGALNFSILVSIILFTLGILYLLKKQPYAIEFIFYTILINLTASIFQIFPFGGSRLNIYYMPLIIYICSCGIYFIIKNLKSFENILFILFVVFTTLNLISSVPSYYQTTRYFDQNSASEIIQFITKSDKDILIYHGGVWTIGAYFEEGVRMEKLSYPFRGSGVSDIPTPEFKNKNIHVICKKYENNDLCFNKITEFLNVNNFSEIYLSGIHIREYQYLPYEKALRNFYGNEEIIIDSEETTLVRYFK